MSDTCEKHPGAPKPLTICVRCFVEMEAVLTRLRAERDALKEELSGAQAGLRKLSPEEATWVNRFIVKDQECRDLTHQAARLREVLKRAQWAINQMSGSATTICLEAVGIDDLNAEITTALTEEAGG